MRLRIAVASGFKPAAESSAVVARITGAVPPGVASAASAASATLAVRDAPRAPAPQAREVFGPLPDSTRLNQRLPALLIQAYSALAHADNLAEASTAIIEVFTQFAQTGRPNSLSSRLPKPRSLNAAGPRNNIRKLVRTPEEALDAVEAKVPTAHRESLRNLMGFLLDHTRTG